VVSALVGPPNGVSSARMRLNEHSKLMSTSPSGSASEQGPTLVHSSAQLVPSLTQQNTLHILNTPSHTLNKGYTTPPRTPGPIQSAQVELKTGRV